MQALPKLQYGLVLIFFVQFLGLGVKAQQTAPISVSFGRTTIALNEPFTITLTLANEQLRKYSPFPNIEGFRKGGISSSSSTNIINGQITFTQSITQSYFPEREGKFSVRPFKMEVNGNEVSSGGTVVNVTPARKQQAQRNVDPFGWDPFEDFFGNTQKEFVDVEEDAFFGVSLSAEDIYVGEGLVASLAFYVSDDNKAQMAFHDLGRQLGEILKDFKPKNCWEENFSIEEVVPVKTTINNRPYTQYKIFESAYFPLSPGELNFPSVGLTMLKYKVAKRPTFFGQNKQEDFKTFFTKPKRVKVRDLPPHPLKNVVSVGRFVLREKLLTNKATTGESIEYQFGIFGEGNIAAIKQPEIVLSDVLEVYPPNTRQNIRRASSRVSGSKSFDFFLTPREPGTLDLSNTFYWVYFDPSKQKYDTLRPIKTLKVTGESLKNQRIKSNISDDFYAQSIERAPSKPLPAGLWFYTRLLFNVLVGVFLLVGLITLVKRKANKK